MALERGRRRGKQDEGGRAGGWVFEAVEQGGSAQGGARVLHQVEGPVLLALFMDQGNPAGCFPSSNLQVKFGF